MNGPNPYTKDCRWTVYFLKFFCAQVGNKEVIAKLFYTYMYIVIVLGLFLKLVPVGV